MYIFMDKVIFRPLKIFQLLMLFNIVLTSFQLDNPQIESQYVKKKLIYGEDPNSIALLSYIERFTDRMRKVLHKHKFKFVLYNLSMICHLAQSPTDKTYLFIPKGILWCSSSVWFSVYWWGRSIDRNGSSWPPTLSKN